MHNTLVCKNKGRGNADTCIPLRQGQVHTAQEADGKQDFHVTTDLDVRVHINTSAFISVYLGLHQNHPVNTVCPNRCSLNILTVFYRKCCLCYGVFLVYLVFTVCRQMKKMDQTFSLHPFMVFCQVGPSFATQGLLASP